MTRLLLPLHVFFSCLLHFGATASLQATTAPVVVAGAGPASLMFSLRYLAQDPNAQVVIYEKRKRPVAADPQDWGTGFRAFGFGIGGRAKAVFEKVPKLIERVKSVTEESLGGLWFVNHQDLCSVMLEALEDEYGLDGSGRLRVVFECPAVAVNDDNTVTIEVEGREERVPYSLLVASDGTNSAIRKCLVDKKLVRCKRFLRDVGWKALKLPPQAQLTRGQAQMYGLTPGDMNRPIEFGGLLPRFKNQFVLLMFWRRKQSTTQTNPFDVQTPQELKDEITKRFANVTAFPPDDVIQSFLDERPGREVYMKLNKHALPKQRIALVGDSAVGMYSLLGQGVASSLERANLLAEKLVGMDNVESALESFSRESVKQGQAISDLNLMSHAWNSPLVKRLYGRPIGIQTVAPLVNNPDWSYADVKRKFRPWVVLGRLLWRFERLPDEAVES